MLPLNRVQIEHCMRKTVSLRVYQLDAGGKCHGFLQKGLQGESQLSCGNFPCKMCIYPASASARVKGVPSALQCGWACAITLLICATLNPALFALIPDVNLVGGGYVRRAISRVATMTGVGLGTNRL